MKKIPLALFLTIFLFSVSTPSFAERPQLPRQPGEYLQQTIRLKDGSVIKGKLIAVNGDEYTIKTSQLGDITINVSNLKSISTESSAPKIPVRPVIETPASNPSPAGAVLPASSSSPGMDPSALLSDPDVSTSIQQIIADPQVMQLLSDSALLNDIMTMDPAKVQNNPKYEELINNPNIKLMMEKLQTKFQK